MSFKYILELLYFIVDVSNKWIKEKKNVYTITVIYRIHNFYKNLFINANIFVDI